MAMFANLAADWRDGDDSGNALLCDFPRHFAIGCSIGMESNGFGTSRYPSFVPQVDFSRTACAKRACVFSDYQLLAAIIGAARDANLAWLLIEVLRAVVRATSVVTWLTSRRAVHCPSNRISPPGDAAANRVMTRILSIRVTPRRVKRSGRSTRL